MVREVTTYDLLKLCFGETGHLSLKCPWSFSSRSAELTSISAPPGARQRWFCFPCFPLLAAVSSPVRHSDSPFTLQMKALLGSRDKGDPTAWCLGSDYSSFFLSALPKIFSLPVLPGSTWCSQRKDLQTCMHPPLSASGTSHSRVSPHLAFSSAFNISSLIFLPKRAFMAFGCICPG